MTRPLKRHHHRRRHRSRSHSSNSRDADSRSRSRSCSRSSTSSVRDRRATQNSRHRHQRHGHRRRPHKRHETGGDTVVDAAGRSSARRRRSRSPAPPLSNHRAPALPSSMPSQHSQPANRGIRSNTKLHIGSNHAAIVANSNRRRRRRNPQNTAARFLAKQQQLQYQQHQQHLQQLQQQQQQLASATAGSRIVSLMDIRVPTPPPPPKLMTLGAPQLPPQNLQQQQLHQPLLHRTESIDSAGRHSLNATPPSLIPSADSAAALEEDAAAVVNPLAFIERQLTRVMTWSRQRLGRVIKNPKHFLQLFVKRAPLEYREELVKPGKKFACCVTLSGVRVGLATSSDRQKAIDRAHYQALTMLDRYSAEEVLYGNPFEKPDLLRPDLIDGIDLAGFHLIEEAVMFSGGQEKRRLAFTVLEQSAYFSRVEFNMLEQKKEDSEKHKCTLSLGDYTIAVTRDSRLDAKTAAAEQMLHDVQAKYPLVLVSRTEEVWRSNPDQFLALAEQPVNFDRPPPCDRPIFVSARSAAANVGLQLPAADLLTVFGRFLAAYVAQAAVASPLVFCGLQRNERLLLYQAAMELRLVRETVPCGSSQAAALALIAKPLSAASLVPALQRFGDCDRYRLIQPGRYYRSPIGSL